MTQEYREGRVRFTGEMLETLVSLIKREKDYGKKKVWPSKWYREQVAEQLRLSEKENPSLRSYEDKMGEIRGNLRVPNPLDAPWSMAAQVNPEHRIAPETVAVVAEVITQCQSHTISVREARWISWLYPSLAPNLQQKWPSDRKQQISRLSVIVSEYSTRERVGEILGTTPDMHALDEVYLIEGSVDPFEAAMRDIGISREVHLAIQEGGAKVLKAMTPEGRQEFKEAAAHYFEALSKLAMPEPGETGKEAFARLLASIKKGKKPPVEAITAITKAASDLKKVQVRDLRREVEYLKQNDPEKLKEMAASAGEDVDTFVEGLEREFQENEK